MYCLWQEVACIDTLLLAVNVTSSVHSNSPWCMQPEICSNISTAPVELYHRVLEAKQCLLHSLCVLPLWMPDITQNAPVAVLEILQPETQPDFESLHELVRLLPRITAL